MKRLKIGLLWLAVVDFTVIVFAAAGSYAAGGFVAGQEHEKIRTREATENLHLVFGKE